MTWSSFFWLRSAGFPFEWLEDMAAMKDCPVLDRYESLHAERTAIESRVAQLVRDRAPEAAVKVARKMDGRMSIAAAELPAQIRDAASQLLAMRRSLLDLEEKAEENLQQRFAADLVRIRGRLISCLSIAEVQEAIFLSNPESLQRIEALLEQDTARIDSRGRQRLRLGWNYLQRLCAKNDTASFFGPVAWGRFSAADPTCLRIRNPAGHWIAARKTFIEHWLIVRLAGAIESDPDMVRGLPLHLSAACRYEGGILHYPIARARKLEPLGAALLDLILLAEGGACRNTVLAGLQQQGHDVQRSDAMLDFLLSKGVLVHGLAGPPGGEEPLSRLIETVDRASAPLECRQRWTRLLQRVDALAHRFSTSDLADRRATLEEMKHCLAEGGVDLARGQGRMYVGRLPVYEDCERNLRLEIGGRLLEELRREMRPLMGLYCWLAGAVAVRLHESYVARWHALAMRPGVQTPTVDLLEFLLALPDSNCAAGVIDDLRAALAKCWQDIVAGRGQAEEISLSSSDLAALSDALARVEPRAASFPGTYLGVHSPDFLLAARDEWAVAAGDYLIVLGEVHPGVHTLSQPVAQPFCPYRDGVRKEVSDILGARFVTLADSHESYQRSHIDWPDVAGLVQVVLPGAAGRVDASRCLPAGRGQVHMRDGVLTYRDDATDTEQDFITLNPGDLHRACFALAGDLLGQALSARLRHGRMIIKRRSWSVEAAEMPQAGQPGERLQDFLAWRRWACAAGMPRFVFVKADTEPKPVYVDFHNPLSLDLLANLAKSCGAMRFSEMRPAPDELWLRDDRGRFCCEFRTSWAAPDLQAAPQSHQGRRRSGIDVCFN